MTVEILKNMTFFIVDDDLFYQRILEQQLKNMGIQHIEIFTNGIDCLYKIHQNPDVVFLDYNMDSFTGSDVLDKIKRFNPDIYVVIISGQTDIQPVADTLKLGAFDYIQKGKFEVIKIKEVLHRIIEIKSLLKIPRKNRGHSFKKTLGKLFGFESKQE